MTGTGAHRDPGPACRPRRQPPPRRLPLSHTTAVGRPLRASWRRRDHLCLGVRPRPDLGHAWILATPGSWPRSVAPTMAATRPSAAIAMVARTADPGSVGPPAESRRPPNAATAVVTRRTADAAIMAVTRLTQRRRIKDLHIKDLHIKDL